jgi:hypothetical protein
MLSLVIPYDDDHQPAPNRLFDRVRTELRSLGAEPEVADGDDA